MGLNSITQFATSVREKFPGEYDSWDDDDLAIAVASKYEEYKQRIDWQTLRPENKPKALRNLGNDAPTMAMLGHYPIQGLQNATGYPTGTEQPLQDIFLAAPPQGAPTAFQEERRVKPAVDPQDDTDRQWGYDLQLAQQDWDVRMKAGKIPMAKVRKPVLGGLLGDQVTAEVDEPSEPRPTPSSFAASRAGVEIPRGQRIVGDASHFMRDVVSPVTNIFTNRGEGVEDAFNEPVRVGRAIRQQSENFQLQEELRKIKARKNAGYTVSPEEEQILKDADIGIVDGTIDFFKVLATDPDARKDMVEIMGSEAPLSILLAPVAEFGFARLYGAMKQVKNSYLAARTAAKLKKGEALMGPGAHSADDAVARAASMRASKASRTGMADALAEGDSRFLAEMGVPAAARPVIARIGREAPAEAVAEGAIGTMTGFGRGENEVDLESFAKNTAQEGLMEAGIAVPVGAAKASFGPSGMAIEDADAAVRKLDTSPWIQAENVPDGVTRPTRGNERAGVSAAPGVQSAMSHPQFRQFMEKIADSAKNPELSGQKFRIQGKDLNARMSSDELAQVGYAADADGSQSVRGYSVPTAGGSVAVVNRAGDESTLAHEVIHGVERQASRDPELASFHGQIEAWKDDAAAWAQENGFEVPDEPQALARYKSELFTRTVNSRLGGNEDAIARQIPISKNLVQMVQAHAGNIVTNKPRMTDDFAGQFDDGADAEHGLIPVVEDDDIPFSMQRSAFGGQEDFFEGANGNGSLKRPDAQQSIPGGGTQRIGVNGKPQTSQSDIFGGEREDLFSGKPPVVNPEPSAEVEARIESQKPPESAKSSTTEINDFGEKIGGAKKDLWRNRNLRSDDLSGMTDREAQKFVTKSAVWKEPDWKDEVEKLTSGGLDESTSKRLAYVKKSLRDAIPPPDAAWDKAVLDTYINSVSKLRDRISGMQSLSDATYEKILRGAYGDDILSGYGLNPNAQNVREVSIFGRTFVKDIFNGIRVSDKFNKAVQKGWPTSDEPWRKVFQVARFQDRRSGKTSWYAKAWSAKASPQRFSPPFEIKEDAIAWAQTKTDEIEALKNTQKGSAKTGGPEGGEGSAGTVVASRSGGKDWRKGRDVSGEDMLKDFGFRGGEFGKWASQAERQASLNFAYDSLNDLAEVMGVPPKAISLNGELAIAFGARGSGAAKAHYESGRVVINLTKTMGAGSLAHEWAHAVDDYFSRQAGVKSIGGESWVSHGALPDDNKLRPEMAAAWKKVVRSILLDDNFNKSQFVKNAEATGKYWSRKHELFARSFDEWLGSELEGRGIVNTYLAKTRAFYDESGVFPEGSDRTRIREALSEFAKTIKTKPGTDGRVIMFSLEMKNGIKKVPESLRNRMERFWDAAVSNKSGNEKFEMTIGAPSEKLVRAISAALGKPIKVNLQKVSLGNVRHTVQQHGNAEAERSKGQLPVTKDVFLLIPHALTNFDSVDRGSLSRGDDAVVIRKAYADGTVVMADAVTKNGDLDIRTFYVKDPDQSVIWERRRPLLGDQPQTTAAGLSGTRDGVQAPSLNVQNGSAVPAETPNDNIPNKKGDVNDIHFELRPRHEQQEAQLEIIKVVRAALRKEGIIIPIQDVSSQWGRLPKKAKTSDETHKRWKSKWDRVLDTLEEFLSEHSVVGRTAGIKVGEASDASADGAHDVIWKIADWFNSMNGKPEGSLSTEMDAMLNPDASPWEWPENARKQVSVKAAVGNGNSGKFRVLASEMNASWDAKAKVWNVKDSNGSSTTIPYDQKVWVDAESLPEERVPPLVLSSRGPAEQDASMTQLSVGSVVRGKSKKGYISIGGEKVWANWDADDRGGRWVLRHKKDQWRVGPNDLIWVDANSVRTDIPESEPSRPNPKPVTPEELDDPSLDWADPVPEDVRDAKPSKERVERFKEIAEGLPAGMRADFYDYAQARDAVAWHDYAMEADDVKKLPSDKQSAQMDKDLVKISKSSALAKIPEIERKPYFQDFIQPAYQDVLEARRAELGKPESVERAKAAPVGKPLKGEKTGIELNDNTFFTDKLTRKDTGKFLTRAEKAYAAGVDEAYPIEKVQKLYDRAHGVTKFEDSIGAKVDQVRGSAGKAKAHAEARLDPIYAGGQLVVLAADGAKQKIKLARLKNEQMLALDRYLVAKTALWRYQNDGVADSPNGSKDGKFKFWDEFLTEKKAQEWISIAEKRSDFKDLEKRAKLVWDFHRNLSLMKLDSGHWTPEMYAQITADPYYVPLIRDVRSAYGQKSAQAGKGPGAYTSSDDLVRGHYHLDRQVSYVRPYVASRIDDEATFVELAKAEVARAVVELSRKDSDGVGQLVAKLEDGEEPGAGTAVVPVMEDGKVVRYKIDDELAEYIMGMGAFVPQNALVKLVVAWNNFWKGMTTSMNPDFSVANVSRDVQESLLNTALGGVRGLVQYFAQDLRKGFWAAVTKDEIFQKYRLGGGMMDSFDVQGGHGSSVDDVLYGGLWAKASDPAAYVASSNPKLSRLYDRLRAVGRGAADVAGALGNVSEMSTRLAMYQRTLRQGGSEAEAIRAARQGTLDFQRHGTLGKKFNAFIPFFNAAIQGNDKTIRTLIATDKAGSSDRGKTVAKRLAKVAAFGLIPTTALVIWNSQNDEYEKIPASERENNWIIMLQGKEYLKVPKAAWQKLLCNSAQTAMEQILGVTTAEATPVWQTAVRSLAGATPIGEVSGILPPFAKTLIEEQINKDFYFRTPIWSENLDPRMQISPWTSETMKKVGWALGLSPARMEHIMRGVFGGNTQNILFLSDLALSARDDVSLPKTKRVPFLKRFYGQTQEWGGDMQRAEMEITKALRAARGDGKKELKKLVANQNREAKAMEEKGDTLAAKQIRAMTREYIKAHGEHLQLLMKRRSTVISARKDLEQMDSQLRDGIEGDE